MKSVSTLTMNPAIDTSCVVDRVRHTHKLRATDERYAAGGGGLNVARVFNRIGGNAHCYYLSGGATGPALDGLIAADGLDATRIAIAGNTRMATAVRERETGHEYRFTPGGPEVSESEWRACLDLLASAPCDYLVLSGSLPRGVPEDFYARLATMLTPRGTRIVVDTSGPALRHALDSGAVMLAKPSLDEFEALTGRRFDGHQDVCNAASQLVQSGKIELIAVTLGREGAVLADVHGARWFPAIAVETQSAVGAGDSFVAGMVHKLAEGASPHEAFRYGMAAGAAAALTPGSDLAYPPDIERLFSCSADG